MRSLLRLVTFDVNGTLLSTKPEYFYAKVAKNYDLQDFDSTRALRTFKESMKRLQMEHPIYGKYTGLGWNKWWQVVIHDVFKDQYQDISTRKLHKITDNLIEWYMTSNTWQKYPGTIELLENLKKRDVALGVISNSDKRLKVILNSSGLEPYFSFMLTSYNFGIEKPNPAIFQEALRLASEGLNEKIKANEAIHIGDCVNRDYSGARSAGWNAILMNWDNAPIDKTLVDSNDVFSNFKDLKQHFDILLK